MIFGLYHPSPLLIRNRPLIYWMQRLLGGITLLPTLPESAGIGEKGVMLLNPRFFLAGRITAERLRRLGAGRKSGMISGDRVLLIWSARVEDLPDPADFPAFRAGDFPAVDPGKRLRVYDLDGDLRLLEDEIVGYQVQYYRKRRVILEDLRHFHIEGLPPIGENSSLGPGVTLRGGKTRIGRECRVHEHVTIENSRVADHCTILPGTIIRNSSVGDRTVIGPYAHLRDGVVIRPGARVGNFVEMKKTRFGSGSKAMHLSYLGDTRVGKETNIGAGTITCNYDGRHKHPTTIGDRVFVGSGSQLVAPVRISSNSYVGAGSTVTENVPPFALALARARQVNKLKWAKKRKRK